MSGGRLADFVIAGEMKCGTTSVAHHLDEHPALHVSRTRPVRFFDERWDRGLGWYAAQFADAPAGTLVGDDTPNYLFDARAVERLGATLPDVRCIVLLREPVRRAWSHHAHHVRTGFERRSFADAVADELAHGPGEPGTPEGSGYVSRGHYDVTVGRLMDTVGRDRVHVAFFDDLVADPRRTLAAIQRFLGVDDTFVARGIGTVYNVGWLPRSRLVNALGFHLSRFTDALSRPIIRANTRRVDEPEVEPALRRRLDDHLAPHLRGVRELLGVDGPPWLRV